AARFTTNSLGLRGRDPGPMGARGLRLLAVGGSTTECLYLDDGATWPALVERNLTRRLGGEPVWVGNAGISGANARDHVVQVKYLLPQYRPVDVVLVLVGVNDLTVRLSAGIEYTPRPPPTSSAEEPLQIRRAFARAPGRLNETP